MKYGDHERGQFSQAECLKHSRKSGSMVKRVKYLGSDMPNSFSFSQKSIQLLSLYQLFMTKIVGRRVGGLGRFASQPFHSDLKLISIKCNIAKARKVGVWGVFFFRTPHKCSVSRGSLRWATKCFCTS